MKDNNAPCFAIIGRPNNGKSSLVSALTMDDTIAISPRSGTTLTKSKYVYKYNKNAVCYFYDTPGFEQADDIYEYIIRSDETYNAIRNFIKEYHTYDNYKKDIEILKAITASNFVVFIINVSDRFNEDVIGYELEILTRIQRPVLILYNQILDEQNYETEWTEVLTDYGFKNIHKVDPLIGGYQNIKNIFESLYSIDSPLTDKQNLKAILHTHQKHFEDNKERSAIKISEMLYTILKTESKAAFRTNKLTDENKEYVHDKFQKRIYAIEKKTQKEIEIIWGYHQVKIEDYRENYDSKETEKRGLTLKHTIYNILKNKKFRILRYKINENDYDVSALLIKRSLEHLIRLIDHGHANRVSIRITPNDQQLKFNSNWNFEKDELKTIKRVHQSFVKGENTQAKKEKLSKLILEIINRETTVEKDHAEKTNIEETQSRNFFNRFRNSVRLKSNT